MGEPTLAEKIRLRAIAAQNNSDSIKAADNNIAVPQAVNAGIPEAQPVDPQMSSTGFSGLDFLKDVGGVVVEAKIGDLEIVAKPELIQIHVRDHGKAIKVDGASAKVVLLNGTEKSEVMLSPAGDKLEAKGAFKVAKGTKGIATVTLAGKPPATARFEVK